MPRKKLWPTLLALSAALALTGCGSAAAPSFSHPAAAPAASGGAKTVVYRSSLPLSTVAANLQAGLKQAGWLVPQQFDVETHLAKVVKVPPSYLMDVVPPRTVGAIVAADPAAGLAFPLRVYLYRQGGVTYASYLEPSSVLARWASRIPDLSSLTKSLDTELAGMVAAATHGTTVTAPEASTPGQKVQTQSLAAGVHTQQAVAKLLTQITANHWGLNNQHSLATLLAPTGVKVPTGYYVEAFNAKLAGQVMNANLPAGIEIPLRFYFYRQGGKLHLSYLEPSTIFARYHDATLDRLSQKMNAVVSNVAASTAAGVSAAKAAGGVGCG
ncbi:MAG: DUF302 domain-containing protein [Thermaerobacter sp.]|nr:DUF302 domain-containing protein [Thermaerobacter sp.]